MLYYIVRRLIYMVILMLILSVVSFVIIQLPPGDYLSILIEQLENSGLEVSEEQIASLRSQYGLDLPVYLQYFKWFGNLVFRGDMGRSLQWNIPVAKLIGERIILTMVVSLCTLVFTYIVAIPIGIYSATHQYSVGDYTAMVFGFIGLATPNFLLALVLMFLLYRYFGWSVGGLFSPQYQVADWSFGKVIDLLKHLPVPIIVIGTAGTAGMIRRWRAVLLDELHKQYVITARAKGVSEMKLLFKYPIRVAINPMVSHIGGLLPAIISGSAITAIVISLPTVGPLLLQAVMNQDMYVAGSIGMLLGSLGLLGTLISDILLVVVDPRIRFERGARR
jgi:peptide/nickel transport system permease protein